MIIRHARPEDITALAGLEALCFPEAEAAAPETIARRAAAYGKHFWLMLDGGRLAAFVDGPVTDSPDLTDEMYSDESVHNEHGAWQMIFGVCTHPDCRRRGYAETLLRRAADDARSQGRRGLVLTCKDRLVRYYARLGFVSEGVSASRHGGAEWEQMRLSF